MYPDYFFTCDYDVSQFWKNHQMTQIKVINYLQGLHIIAISENTSKYDVIDSKEDTYLGVPLQQIWVLQANNFFKRTSPQFFLEFGKFFQN